MKTETHNREIHVGGHTLGSTALTIAPNAKAFKALMSGLYANKEESITREIWSNAYDAHRAAGREDVPFSVTIPSLLDPVFRVRDYGVSMDHEMVMSLYTTLFTSTKEDTNNEIGKFGLGSKSPFSYTDSYNIVTFKNGEKNAYTTYFDSQSLPVIDHVWSGPTDERDGVEISFPVHTHDIAQFVEAAKKVSVGFGVKPDAGEFEWPEIKAFYAGDNWTVYKSEHISGFMAKQGCAVYPVDTNMLTRTEIDPKVFRFFQTCNVIIDFPIGELEVTVSRESLSYGEREPTVQNLVKRMNAVYAELENTLRNNIEACKTDIEKIAEANRIRSSFRYAQDCFPIVRNYDSVVRSGYGLDVLFCQMSKNDIMHRSRITSWKDTAEFKPGDMNCAIILISEEEARKGVIFERAKEIVSKNGDAYKNYILVKMCSEVPPVHYAKAHTLADIIDTFDVIDISICAAPKKARSGGTATRYYVRRRSSYFAPVDTPMSDADFNAGGVYVEVHRGDVPRYSEKHFLEHDSGVLDSRNVIGITSRYRKKFDQAPNWVSLKQVMYYTYKKYNTEVFEKELRIQKLHNAVKRGIFSKAFSNAVDAVDIFEPVKKVRDMFCAEMDYKPDQVSAHSDMLAEAARYNTYSTYLGLPPIDYYQRNIDPYLERYDRLFSEALRSVYEEYPLVRCTVTDEMFFNKNHVDWQHVKEYKEAVDMYREIKNERKVA